MNVEKKTLTANVIWNGVLSVSHIIFPLITFPYITRVLGVDASGANSFSSSVVNYFQLFATLGMSTYGVKACASVKNDKNTLSKTVHELLTINTVSTFFVLIALYICTMFLPAFANYRSLLWIYSFNILLTVFGMTWMYQGIEHFRYITTCSVIFKMISIVLMFVLVKNPDDLWKYALITVFATNGCNFINIFYSHKFIFIKRIGDYNFKRHIKPILFLFGTALAVNIYSHMDSVMLGLISGDYATGIYYVAVKVKTILLTLISSFSIVIMSRLSYINNKKNTQKSFELLKLSYSIMVLIAFPVMVFFILFSRDSVLFLSGAEFVEAAVPMSILMPTVFISAVSQIIGNQYSVSIGKEKNLMIAVTAGAIVNIIANSIFIPLYSYNGAAIGTLLAEITQCLIQMSLARNMVKSVFKLSYVLKTIAGSGVAAAICCIFSSIFQIENVFFNLLVFAIIYFLVYFVVVAIEKYDICMDVFNMVRKKIKGN